MVYNMMWLEKKFLLNLSGKSENYKFSEIWLLPFVGSAYVVMVVEGLNSLTQQLHCSTFKKKTVYKLTKSFILMGKERRKFVL